MATTLGIQYDGSVTADADAWLVPGDDPADWLSEVARWGVPMNYVTLRVVPTISTSQVRTAVGVVVTLSSGPAPERIRRAVAYVRIAGRLLVPANARIHPPVTDSELQRLMPADPAVELLWHPQHGLIAYEASDQMSASDLISPPCEQSSDWSRSVPGERINDRLISVSPAVELSFEQIIKESRNEIGDAGKPLDDLPRAPGESAFENLRDAARSVMKPVARLADWLADRVPESSNRRTWANAIQEWASRILTPRDAGPRDNLLKRLMKMLDDDPDKGLQYAVPLADGSHRGVGDSVGGLIKRLVDFSLGGIFGGGSSGGWITTDDTYQQLRRRYRELAQREIRLGRYRRAAYIFARLLHDYTSAAAALKEGKHYREAAIVYLEKLKLRTEAANCYRLAGMPIKAAELFEEERLWSSAADVYQSLAMQQDADRCWTRLAEEHIGNSRLIDASKVYEGKLRKPSDSLRVLDEGWERDVLGRECLREWFRVIERLGLSDAEVQRIRALERQTAQPRHRQTACAKVFSTLAADSPDPDVRTTAADSTQRIVSRMLPGANQTEARELLRHIQSLQPHDRLLSHDCERFVRRIATALPSGFRRAQRGLPEPKFQHELRLLSSVIWMTAQTSLRKLYAVGTAGNSHVLAVGSLEPPSERDVPKCLPLNLAGRSQQAILMSVDPIQPDSVMLHVRGVDPSQLQGLGHTSARGIVALRTAPVTAQTMAMIQTTAAETIRVDLDGRFGFAVVCVNRNGLERWRAELPVNLREVFGLAMTEVVPVLAKGPKHVFVGIGRHVFTIPLATPNSASIVDCQQHEVVSHLACSAPNTLERLLCLLPDSAVLRWPLTGAEFRIGHGLIAPVGCIIGSGHAVLAGQGGVIEVYAIRSKSHSCELVSTLRTNLNGPIAVQPGRIPSEFVVFASDGLVKVYRV